MKYVLGLFMISLILCLLTGCCSLQGLMDPASGRHYGEAEEGAVDDGDILDNGGTVPDHKDSTGTFQEEAPDLQGDPSGNIMFYNADADFAFVYPGQGLTLSSYASGPGVYGDISLDVSITPLDTLEGNMRESALEEMENLQEGEFCPGIDLSFEPSRNIRKLGGINIKEFMVLSGYSICDAVFQQKAVFFNNGNRVQISVSADRDIMIESISRYFMYDEANCLDRKVWTPDGKDGFYSDLVSGDVPDPVLRWDRVFDEVSYLLQVNEFKGASAGYNKIIDKRYLEENTRQRYFIDVAYPRFQSAVTGRLDESINSMIHDDTIMPAIEGFSQEVSSYGYTDENINYFLSIDYQVAAYTPDLISVCLDVAPYMGGAHGMLYFYTFNLDMADNSLLGLEDLFRDGYDHMQEISEYCRLDLIRQMQERGFQPDEGWIEDGTDPSYTDTFNNFLVTPEGVIIKFPAYQVGPYAAGDFTVEIPYNHFGNNIRDLPWITG